MGAVKAYSQSFLTPPLYTFWLTFGFVECAAASTDKS